MGRLLGLGTLVKKYPPLYRQLNRIRKWRLHDPNIHMPYKVLGNTFCDWGVPDNYLSRCSIVYSVGVGQDISFDLALVDRYGCKVFSFDPTPIAMEFMDRCDLPDEINFTPIGLSSHDGMMAFYTPQKQGSDCFSKVIDPSDGESAKIQCETLTLASVMKRLGHDHIDLLKIDIEGFEYEVIDEMISSGSLPNCLLVEFHHGMFGIEAPQTYRAVESLLGVGYRIFWVSDLGREYGLVRDLNRVASEPNPSQASAVEH